MTDKFRHLLDELRANQMADLDLNVHLGDHIGEIEALLEDHDLSNPEIIRFKEGRKGHDLRQEFEACDNRLRFIFDAYASFMWRKHKYKPRITVLARMQTEQDYIYTHVDDATTARYLATPWRSPHQDMRGLDFSDNDMTPEQIKDTEHFFDDMQIIYTGEKKTVIRHSVGKFGSHWHLQVDRDRYTCIERRDA